MTNDKLPGEIQEQIKQNAEDFANSHVNGRAQRDIWELVFNANEAGATAWAPWKVMHDEERKERVHLDKENDLLKAKYQDLQAQAQRMTDALDEILKQHTYYDVIELAANALQQFKDGKGKEVRNG